jgi:hypothetical protein
MQAEELLALKGEIKMQCFRAMNAADELENYLKVKIINYDRTDSGGPGKALIAFTVDVWAKVHTILSAAGIVSRILWPLPPSEAPPRTRAARIRKERAIAARERADEIWRSWPMPARSLLGPLENREVRNAFEHAENGAAEWMEAFGKGKVRAYGVGVESTTDSQTDSKRVFRYFFHDSWRVKIGDGDCKLRAVVGALSELQASLPFEVEMSIGGIEFRPVDPGTSTPGLHWERRSPSAT